MAALDEIEHDMIIEDGMKKTTADQLTDRYSSEKVKADYEKLCQQAHLSGQLSNKCEDIYRTITNKQNGRMSWKQRWCFVRLLVEEGVYQW